MQKSDYIEIFLTRPEKVYANQTSKMSNIYRTNRLSFHSCCILFVSELKWSTKHLATVFWYFLSFF